MMTSDFRETLKTAILEEIQNKNRTTREVAKTTTTIIARKTTTRNRKTRQSISRDRSELQRLCRYNRCKAIHANGEGWKPAFRRGNKGVFPQIQDFGGVLRLELKLFKINF